MDMNLNKLWEWVMDREAWGDAIHGVTKTRTPLSDWTEVNHLTYFYFILSSQKSYEIDSSPFLNEEIKIYLFIYLLNFILFLNFT